MSTIKKNNNIIKYDEWIKKGVKLFGKDKRKWKFVCCNCGNAQSIEDFEKHNINNPEKKVYFSCIGRYIGGKGELGNNKTPCNYTLGGLIDISTLQVDKDGNKISVFEFLED